MNNMYTTYFLFRDKNYKRREELEVDGMPNTPFPEYWNYYIDGKGNSFTVDKKLTMPFISPDCKISHIWNIPSYTFCPYDNNMFVHVASLEPIQIRMSKLRRFYKKRNADVYIFKENYGEYYVLMNVHTKKIVRITSDPQKLETLIQTFGWHTDEYLEVFGVDYSCACSLLSSIRAALLLECGDIEDFFKYVEMPDSNKELCWAA